MPSTIRIKQGIALRADLAGAFLLPADLNFAMNQGSYHFLENNDVSSVVESDTVATCVAPVIPCTRRH